MLLFSLFLDITNERNKQRQKHKTRMIIIIIIYHTIILSSSSYIVICLRCLSCIFFVIMVKNGSRLSLPPLPPPTLLQLDGMVSGPPYFSRDYYQLYSPSFLPYPCSLTNSSVYTLTYIVL